MGSKKGAKAAANIYSMIETAKLNDINPEGYMKFVLEHKTDATNADLLKSLMPWNAKIEAEYPKPSLKPKDTELEKIKEKNTS